MSFREKAGNSILYSNFFFIFEKTAYFQRVKNGHHGGILKIMILHCPSTHKHRLVLILASSFCIHRSPLEVTVSSTCFQSISRIDFSGTQKLDTSLAKTSM